MKFLLAKAFLLLLQHHCFIHYKIHTSYFNASFQSFVNTFASQMLNNKSGTDENVDTKKAAKTFLNGMNMESAAEHKIL